MYCAMCGKQCSSWQECVSFIKADERRIYNPEDFTPMFHYEVKIQTNETLVEQVNHLLWICNVDVIEAVITVLIRRSYSTFLVCKMLPK